jgi:hypothetical protein
MYPPIYSRPAAVGEKMQAPNDVWSHGIGRVCFERTIDPELYRIEKPIR